MRVAADTTRMEWAPSPSASVWRKRVYLVGPAESGEVTSVVRYEPDSSFPAHDHPEGEEIIVLDLPTWSERTLRVIGRVSRLAWSIIHDLAEDAFSTPRGLVCDIFGQPPSDQPIKRPGQCDSIDRP